MQRNMLPEYPDSIEIEGQEFKGDLFVAAKSFVGVQDVSVKGSTAEPEEQIKVLSTSKLR